MVIKVLGPGCAKCKEAETVVKDAVQAGGGVVSMEKITDFREIMALGVLSTPPVVIDGKIMCSGRVPSRGEVLNWIGPGGGSGLKKRPPLAAGAGRGKVDLTPLREAA